jgi:hypothetical protein
MPEAERVDSDRPRRASVVGPISGCDDVVTPALRVQVSLMERRETEANQRRKAAEAAQEKMAAEKRQLQEHLQVGIGDDRVMTTSSTHPLHIH